jgi:hypothetical protein
MRHPPDCPCDANDKLINPANPVGHIAAGYHTDAGWP